MKILNQLTNRESEILHLVSQGFSSQEIAKQLFLSVETIKSHRKNMLSKFDARNMAHMVRVAFRYQMLS